MDLCLNSVLSDVNVPNHIDELDELLNSTWDHKAIDQGDIDALYAELSNSVMLTPVPSPTAVHEDSDVLFNNIGGYDIKKEQVPCSGMLTPQASPRMCTEVADDTVIQQPVPDSASQQVETAVQKQFKPIPNASPVYQISNMEQPKNFAFQQNCADVIQSIKTEPMDDFQSPNQANIRPAPIQVLYQSPKDVFLTQTSFSPMTHIPYYTQQPRACFKEYTLQSNTAPCAEQEAVPVFTLASQQAQESVSSSREAMCCEPESSIEPVPGMSCAEYLSSVQIDSDCPDPPETSPAYYIYVPESQISPRIEATTVPVPTVSPVPESIIKVISSPTGFVQIQNNYVLPSEGTIKAYPVEEIYRVDRQESASTTQQPPQKKKPRKANISYGTEFYCHICRKEFGKRGSFQQHWRQKHEETRPFRCETCGKSYLTERDLQHHQQNHDPGMKQWKCTKCDNRYRHMKDRDRHFDTHHGTPAHPCVIEGCEKAFARRDHMLAHLVSHDNRTMRELKKAQVKEEKEQNRKQRGRKRKAE